ncbi:hypothetical protein E4U41_005240, partial [Claviceps citrina]
MSCSSACEGSCPSRCGDAGDALCCEDDACGSPRVCVDEDCLEGSQPCTDENCFVDASAQQPEMASGLSDTDKAAAAALASFGDSQSQHMLPSMYMQEQQQQQHQQPSPLPDASRGRNLDMHWTNLASCLPCPSLSMESIVANLHGAASFANQPFQKAFEYALASHIMQYHDPAHGLAHNRSCVANDPGQLITRCTLPRYNPDDLADTDPFLPQLQAHECGFPIQDPNEFAHHIFQQHRPDLMVQSHQYGFAGPPSYAAAAHSPPPNLNHHYHHHHHHGGPGPWFDFNAAPDSNSSKHLSPSMSPLTNLSMGPSLSATPLSIPTPSPLESEASFADATTAAARTLSPAAEAKSQEPSQGMAQDDPYLCRWLVGPGSSSICGQRFDNDEQLQKHCKHEHLKQLKKVNGGFQCGWINCTRDTSFTQRSKVERHMQVHTG